MVALPDHPPLLPPPAATPTPTPSDPAHPHLLDTLLHHNLSLLALTREHNLSAARLTAFARDPFVIAELSEIRRLATTLFRLREEQVRTVAIDTLEALAADPGADPTERRRAASAILLARRSARARASSPPSPPGRGAEAREGGRGGEGSDPQKPVKRPPAPTLFETTSAALAAELTPVLEPLIEALVHNDDPAPTPA